MLILFNSVMLLLSIDSNSLIANANSYVFDLASDKLCKYDAKAPFGLVQLAYCSSFCFKKNGCRKR